MKQPVFTLEPNGSVTVDEFTPRLIITRKLIEDAHPALLSRERRAFRIRCANGAAEYRMTRRGPYPGTFECLRVA